MQTLATRGIGAGETASFRDRVDLEWERLVAQSTEAQRGSPPAVAKIKQNMSSQLALMAMPDADFLVALHRALELSALVFAGQDYGIPPADQFEGVVLHVNSLFEKRGVPYRVTHEGFGQNLALEFEGDQGLHELVVTPALAALPDPGLAGARDEFEDALMRTGTHCSQPMTTGTWRHELVGEDRCCAGFQRHG
jgi:hypothetical protein